MVIITINGSRLGSNKNLIGIQNMAWTSDPRYLVLPHTIALFLPTFQPFTLQSYSFPTAPTFSNILYTLVILPGIPTPSLFKCYLLRKTDFSPQTDLRTWINLSVFELPPLNQYTSDIVFVCVYFPPRFFLEARSSLCIPSTY